VQKIAAGTVTILALVASSTATQAAAWCAYYDPYTYNCGFRTLEQCRATISGDATAWCSPNYREGNTEPRRGGRQPR
jgi:hypothetical protein